MKWKFKKILVKLLKFNNTPQEIAFGVAIGVFVAILPVYGLHTVLIVIAAILIRPANKIAMLVGTNISLPPTVPFITWAGYELGRLVLRGNFEPLKWSDFKNITFQNIASKYQPLFVGSVILGIICACIFYLVTFFIIRVIWDKRKHVQRARHKDKKI